MLNIFIHYIKNNLNNIKIYFLYYNLINLNLLTKLHAFK